jgi:Zn-dependent protease with chaperone function
LARNPKGRDGVPYQYDDGTAWLRAGFHRHGRAVVTALIFSWTGAWLVLWGAAFGVIFGVFVAFGVISSTAIGHDLVNLGVGQGVTVATVLSGAVFGIAGAVLAVVNVLYLDRPLQVLASLIVGFVITVLMVVVQAAFERAGLRMRGYRRLSRDEVRRIAPLVKDVADAMALPALPRFAMANETIPNAWTHMRTIVLTTGILQTLDDAELRAVLAHELHHWEMGDSVGLHAISAAAWPIALFYTLGMLLAGRGPDQAGGTVRPPMFRTVLSIVGWFIAWPAWIITKFVIVPVTASSQRRYEYEADAAAALIGLGPSLASALSKLTAFEGGRTTWEAAMNATHPPVQLRIEALQPATDDDWQYQEEELRAPTWAEIARLFSGLGSPRPE